MEVLSPFKYKGNNSNLLIYMADGHFGANGMFDRLKGIITLYAISKITNKDFRIYFNVPFSLSNYLIPNIHNWYIDSDSINYHYPASTPVIANSVYTSPLFRVRNRETHFYCCIDFLDLINKRYNKNFDFGTLYCELFKPSKHLECFLNDIKGSEPYIAIHVRMVNLLGEKIECVRGFPVLEEGKDLLLSKIKSHIVNLKERNKGFRCMISTDSNKFLNYIKKEIPDLYVYPGEIKHIGNNDYTSDEENIKLFMDYYLLSKAVCVYSIVGEGLYVSAFPYYAAKIGNVPFKRVSLE